MSDASVTAAVAAAMLVLAGAAAGPAAAQSRTVDTETGRVRVETVADGLEHPWALAFLPDGRMLVTERPGRLRIVGTDGALSAPLAGVPQVFAEGQGGLLDVALDPDFEANRYVYVSFAEAGSGGAATAVARGRLGDGWLDGTEVIFRQQPMVQGSAHFGGRLVFDTEGALFVALGERFKFDPAQDLSNHLGTIVRIRPDGSVPDDNPFAGQQGKRPEIWSYGHRNIEGAALHPQTGELWIHEMGPRGGDELTLPEAGANYGWPVVSWGEHYDGRDIPDPPTHPEFAGSIHQWTPVIAPSGMAFYTGDRFEAWQGNLLIGGLVSRGVVRLRLDGAEVTGEERIPLGARIRDVRQGPDGAVWVLTDEANGRLLRLTPG